MFWRPNALLITSIVLVLATPAVGPAARAQSQEQGEEQQTPEPAPEGEAEEKPGEPAEGAAPITDRLTLRAGPTVMLIRAGSRSDSVYRDTQTGEHTTTVNEVSFDTSTGSGFSLDGWYEVRKNWYVIGSVAITTFGQADYTDSRGFSRLGGPGETELVSFGAQHESELLDWAIGGARRVFPTKRYKDSRMYVDAILLLGGTDASFTFESGEVLSDPFSAPAYNPGLGFDPRGLDSSNWDLEYQTLRAGARFGGRIGERIALEGHFLPTWFGRFDGAAELGSHGSALAHPPGTMHDPIGDPSSSGFNEVVQNDLFAPTVEVEQDSTRVSGLSVGLNSVLTLNDWLSIDFGYVRNFSRSVGGSEKRIYSDEDLAGCPSPGPVDPLDPTLGFKPPKCADDEGDLLEGSLVADSVYVMGRFRLY